MIGLCIGVVHAVCAQWFSRVRSLPLLRRRELTCTCTRPPSRTQSGGACSEATLGDAELAAPRPPSRPHHHRQPAQMSRAKKPQ
eukprot:scaffold222_cov336-Prasinococcus_capsulatus_cf.AAC.4